MQLETSPPELERLFDAAFPDAPERLREWLQRAFEDGAASMAKEKKPPKPRKASR
jgi:hypothetical protein